jgi:asparagine synthase (glutamine-hydrolysing)
VNLSDIDSPATSAFRSTVGLLSGVVDLERLDAASLNLADISIGRDQTRLRTLRAPGITFSIDAHQGHFAVSCGLIALVIGTPRFSAQAAPRAETPRLLAAWLQTFGADPLAAARALGGAFALVVIDPMTRRVALAIDRLAIVSLCYRVNGSRIEFGDRADGIASHQDCELDVQSIFNYLYFHVIPSPRTIYESIRRIEPAQAVTFDTAGTASRRYWIPTFQADARVDLDALKSEFLDNVRNSVTREADTDDVGAFLSGGTDSSTVAGMLCQASGRPAKTFSIGFEAQGYDEMEYARIAARHFGTDHHEYYVTPADLVNSIPSVAAYCDQPFGNSSTLPAYVCANLARKEGIGKLLAGDGGDELFGGNTRYAKQRVFEWYGNIPASLRSGAIEPLMLSSPLGSLPGLRKGASYVRQARVPLPDRLNTYNLLHRMGLNTVLTPAFLARVNIEEPDQSQRSTYAVATAKSYIDRMLAYDWVYTLAENDLRKVANATGLAGVRVGYPLLSDELLAMSLRLAPTLKVRGVKLRYFFKESLKGFLPPEIITKKKHGFGLPFGVWALRDDNLRRLATDSIERFGERGIVDPKFVRTLLDEHLPTHPGYYGELVWILMMLENWIAQKRPDFRLNS